MLKIEKSHVIDAPVEAVFAYLLDPTHMPEYWVGVDEVTDVQRKPDGRFTVTTVGRLLGMRFVSKAEVVEIVPNERVVGKGRNWLIDFTHPAWLERLEGGKTRLSGVFEYTVHGGFLGRLCETLFATYFDHAAEMTGKAAKAHIEQAHREAQALTATPS